MIKNIHRRGRRERRERIRQPARKQALSSSLAPDSIVSVISMAFYFDVRHTLKQA